MGELDGRIAFVTGCGSGLGREIALTFARAGARVAVNDLRAAAAGAVHEELGSLGAPSPCAPLVGDVSDSAQVKRWFESLGEATGGRLDVLVNNAGYADMDPETEAQRARQLEELLATGRVTTTVDTTRRMPDERWTRMLAVHLNGTFFCTREALRLMARRNRGVIINMSSVAALMGLEAAPHYSAAKGGILAFTRALSREVASRGIRVNAICPGYIDTPMTRPISPAMQKVLLARTPLGRWGEPEEVASTALFLASDDGAYFTGQWLSPNGGLHIG